MNQATQLLTDLYTSREVAAVVKRLEPADLRDDMLQHVFCELFAKDPADIEEMHQQGRLRGYVALMLYNTAWQYKGKFHTQRGRDRTGKQRELSTDFSYIDQCSGHNVDGECDPPFAVALRQYIASIDMRNDLDIEAEILEAETIRKVLDGISQLKWYDRGIFELYMETGTYVAASNRTGIPVTSIFTTVRKVKNQLSKTLNNE